MRIGKKTIAFAIALAMSFAIGFSIASKTDVYAEGFTPTVSSDGSFRATGANKEVQVGVVTVNKNGKATVKNWDTYAVVSGEAHGFFALTPKKDMYVAFRTVEWCDGLYTTPIIWEIRKNPSKFKATIAIDAEKDLAKLVVEENGSNYTGQIRARVGRSEDNPIHKEGESFIIDEGLYSTGATLQITPLGESINKPNISKVTYLGEEIAIAGSVKSDAKSVNVKLKKRAKAPKALIKYATGKAVIRKDTSYRIIEQEGFKVAKRGEFIANSSKKEVELAGDNGILQVIKPSTGTSLASNIGVATYTKNVFDEDKVTVVSSEGLGLKISNNSDTDIDYQIGTNLKKEWKRIKKGGRVSIVAKKVNTSEGAKVFCRAAADEKECKIPGKVVEYDYLNSENKEEDDEDDPYEDSNTSGNASGNASGSADVSPKIKLKVTETRKAHYISDCYKIHFYEGEHWHYTNYTVDYWFYEGNYLAVNASGVVKLVQNGEVVYSGSITNGFAEIKGVKVGTYTVEISINGDEYKAGTYDKYVVFEDVYDINRTTWVWGN